jgi:anthranilate phosphoribosyltransferase
MIEQLTPQDRMRAYLQLVATGPELSKSLSEPQAEDGMSMILDGEVDAVRAGIFLIALRMKRETEPENLGTLKALNRAIQHATARSSEIIALADPFNGYLRGLPATPFLPAVLAACGLPAYIHGLEAVGPKYGITPRMIFEAAGKQIDRSVKDAVSCIDNKDIGWSYVDQKQYLPKLHDLVELRDTMVKRTCISTLEVVMKPVSGATKTHLMTGFVHKAYPPVYALLAKSAGFDTATIVRGVEGGCIPSLSQVSRYFAYEACGDMRLYKLVPGDIGVIQDKRMVPIPEQYENEMAQTAYLKTGKLNSAVDHALELGVAALSNKPGAMFDSLIYGASIALNSTGVCESLQAAADKVRQAIASGEVLARFEAA